VLTLRPGRPGAPPAVLALVVALWFALDPVTAAAAAPQAAADSGALKVFLDCGYRCDEDYLRREVLFVNYVRDRKDADVHVLVTTQGTGGGGTEYTLKFIGLGRFAGQDTTLTYVSLQTQTSDETRQGLARVLKVGLVSFAAATPLGDRLDVTYRAPEARTEEVAGGEHDPWNFWVFRLSTGGNFSGEASSTRQSLRGSLSANRTTAAWKVNLTANTSYSDSWYDLGDGEEYSTVRRSWTTQALIVRSLGAHWSAGFKGKASSSTYLNQHLAVRIAPGVEWNLFPYEESTRRQLTFQYTLGWDRFDYIDETIFDKTSESLADQTLIVSLSLKQPWGSASVSAEASHYLSDPKKNHLTMFAATDVRLFKGFSFNVFGDIARIRDQLYLPKGEATAEEILVQQRQLFTSYSYFFSFGISYSFGSIYNNVVNPRFGGSSGGFTIIG
jgi:hypothetical protein